MIKHLNPKFFYVNPIKEKYKALLKKPFRISVPITILSALRLFIFGGFALHEINSGDILVTRIITILVMVFVYYLALCMDIQAIKTR